MVERMSKLMALLLMILAACDPVITSPSAEPSADASTAKSAEPTKNQPRAAGVLFAIRTAKHSDHDSVEFEFGGPQPPPENHQYEPEIRFDPSDQPVPLQGKAFLRVVFHGAALDNLAYEND